MKNLILVSSKGLTIFLQKIIERGFGTSDHVTIVSVNNAIKMEGTEIILGCETKFPFEVMLYRSTIFKLLKHLALFSQQPIGLELFDSETFNVKILEAYI